MLHSQVPAINSSQLSTRTQSSINCLARIHEKASTVIVNAERIQVHSKLLIKTVFITSFVLSKISHHHPIKDVKDSLNWATFPCHSNMVPMLTVSDPSNSIKHPKQNPTFKHVS